VSSQPEYKEYHFVPFIEVLLEEARRAIGSCGQLDGTKGAKGTNQTHILASACVLAMWSKSGKLRALADTMIPFGNKFDASIFQKAARRSDTDLWNYLFVVASDCGEHGGRPKRFLPGTLHERGLFKSGKVKATGDAKGGAYFTGFKVRRDRHAPSPHRSSSVTVPHHRVRALSAGSCTTTRRPNGRRLLPKTTSGQKTCTKSSPS
jgi:hypothetical protein